MRLAAVVFLFAILFFSEPALSEELTIIEIRIKGLKRTSEQVARQELEFEVGDVYDPADAVESVRRLDNTRIFSKISYTTEQAAGGIFITFNLEERWTTIPIAKFNSGGGVNQYTLGVYDSNLFGEYVEAGAQYEQLGGTDSAVVWFKNPRLFGERFGIDLQYWNISRIRTKYDQKRIDREVTTGFLHRRKMVYVGLNRELHELLRVRAVYERHIDEFSDDFLTDEVKEKLILTGLPPDTTVNQYGLGLTFGVIDAKGPFEEGLEISYDWRQALVRERGIDDFVTDQFELRWVGLYGRYSPALRVLAGSTDTDVLQYWFYLGGLDRIRGFSDNRFAGRTFWATNAELRYSFQESDSLVIQGVGFYDAIGVAERTGDLSDASGASIGTGVRAIAPKIYRLTLRADVAVPVLRQDQIPFSFGVQQFF